MCYFPALSELLTSFLFAALFFVSGMLWAVEPPSQNTAVDELKQLNDQTIIRTNLSLGSEWNHFEHGEEKAIWTLAGLYGWRVSDQQDWGIRFRLPFIYKRTDQPSDEVDVGGVGDAEIGVGTAFRLNDTWRTAGGIELHADTASDRGFAEEVWRLKWGWGVSHDVTRWLSFAPSADYNRSIAEKNNASPQSYFELSLPATLILPQHWSMSAKYKTAADFENGDRWSHTLSAGVAKRLSNLPLVLSATLEKPLGHSTKKFRVSFTVTYYFQRYHAHK